MSYCKPVQTRGLVVVPPQPKPTHDSDSDEIICLEDKPAVGQAYQEPSFHLTIKLVSGQTPESGSPTIYFGHREAELQVKLGSQLTNRR